MLGLALVSPVHDWGETSFALHMVQHELLMIAAAPLLVLGRPLEVIMHSAGAAWTRKMVHLMRRSGVATLWHGLMAPLTATLVHAAVLWLWHLPSWYDASVRHDGVHTLQHICFLGSALLFWEALLHGRQRRVGYGVAVVYLFVTAMHSGLLGAILTFAPEVVYQVYADAVSPWAATPLQDQQLGGLIMWVPAGVAYVVAALALFAGWLQEVERRARLGYDHAATRPPALKSR
jgi:cytochrome c oxidase assembly factor CtaG